MDPDDYYSYRPRRRLDAPVALVGFPGSNPIQTARVATMLTGLKCVLLPRLVTHHMGRHVEGVLIDGNHEELHRTELLLLQRALAESRSPPVIALGPTTLEDPACRAFCVEHTTIVHLAIELPAAVRNLLAEMKADRRKHQHLRDIGFDEASLASIHGLRTGLYDRLATHRIDVGDRAPLQVGQDLPERLEWTVI